MKKIIYLFLPFMALSACSTDALETEENYSLDAKVAKSQATALVVEFVPPTGVICVGQPAEFTINAEVGSNLQVQQWNETLQEWVQVYHTSKSTSNPQLFQLTFDAVKNYELRYKVGSRGFSDFVIVTVENCGCKESFTYAPGDNANEYVFTYVPAENMTDANLVFTFAQAVTTSGLEGWSTNGQTKQTTIDLTACTSYNWTVTLDKICMGSTGNNNLWTDFKVNEDSKKGELSNIVQSCPQ